MTRRRTRMLRRRAPRVTRASSRPRTSRARPAPTIQAGSPGTSRNRSVLVPGPHLMSLPGSTPAFDHRGNSDAGVPFLLLSRPPGCVERRSVARVGRPLSNAGSRYADPASRPLHPPVHAIVPQRSVAGAAVSVRVAARGAWRKLLRTSPTTSCPSNPSASGCCRPIPRSDRVSSCFLLCPLDDVRSMTVSFTVGDYGSAYR